LATPSEAFTERRSGRWQNENSDGVRHLLLYLCRTLPVDFQYDIHALIELIGYALSTRTVKIVEYLCPLEKPALVSYFAEARRRDEVVVNAIDFA
jgi:hypothetical protein